MCLAVAVVSGIAMVMLGLAWLVLVDQLHGVGGDDPGEVPNVDQVLDAMLPVTLLPLVLSLCLTRVVSLKWLESTGSCSCIWLCPRGSRSGCWSTLEGQLGRC